ncbi:MAG: GYD family protein [Chloroflexi bacterium]|nr:MAG: GYD family protein [Chloroflexota bacterium]
MATFISLANWTDQGVKNAKDSVQRAGEYRAALERRGIKMLSIYWTVGAYDIVLTAEAPDVQTMTSSLLALAGFGNVRTTTLTAFNQQEMQTIIQNI